MVEYSPESKTKPETDSVPKVEEKVVSRIYKHEKNFESHVEGVTGSLENLIFSRARIVSQAIYRKRLLVGTIAFIILTTLSGIISPKGKAEVATFYPTACLGGWFNPHNAEGIPETSGEAPGFSLHNSSMFNEDTAGDIYCGSFKGDVPTSTVPIKMTLTISWKSLSEKELHELKDGTSALDVVSTPDVIDATSTATSSVDLTDASSTIDVATTSVENATSTETSISIPEILTEIIKVVTDFLGITDSENKNDTATTTPNIEEASVSSSTDVITPTNETSGIPVTETAPVEIIPAPEAIPVSAPEPVVEFTPSPEPIPEVSSPQSYLYKVGQKILAAAIESVYAVSDVSVTDPVLESKIEVKNEKLDTSEDIKDKEIVVDDTKKEEKVDVALFKENKVATTSEEVSTSTNDILLEVATSTEINIQKNDEILNSSSNLVFEVFYTLNGNDWTSLGKVEEKNLAFNMFEIPIAASSTWEDISNVQIKIQSLNTKLNKKTTILLDGMTLSINYEKGEYDKTVVVQKIDPKSYMMSVVSTNGDIIADVVKDPSQGSVLSVKSNKGGSISIYKVNEESPVYSGGVGSDPLLINSYIFDPGAFTAVLTNRVNGCLNLMADECVQAPMFVGSANFSVDPTFDTPIEFMHGN